MPLVIIRLENGKFQEIITDDDTTAFFIEQDTYDMPEHTISTIDGFDSFLYTNHIKGNPTRIHQILNEHHASLKRKKLEGMWIPNKGE